MNGFAGVKVSNIVKKTPQCDECNHNVFEEGLIMRKASGLLTGTGQTSYMPIPVFACKACGHVNAEFLPKELKDLG